MQMLAGVQTSMQNAAAALAPVQHVHHQPVTQHFHTDGRQVALVDAMQAIQDVIDGRKVTIVNASHHVLVDARQVTQQASDARQVTQMMQVYQEVNIMPIKIDVEMTAFTNIHRTARSYNSCKISASSIEHPPTFCTISVLAKEEADEVKQAGQEKKEEAEEEEDQEDGGGGPPPNTITQCQLALTILWALLTVNRAQNTMAKTVALAFPCTKGCPEATGPTRPNLIIIWPSCK
ncbi:hypothetical protein N9L68_09095 [bacterium]|nr:hypothetical protein [bacterium]